jgi:3-isopropylmalate/(R)-2-methylmalate dehydratase large subunit
MGRTLYDKIWDEHVVHTEEDGTSILYIDRHLVHEVTSPQAFEGLREAGRKVWRVSSIVATADHNTPTTGWERAMTASPTRSARSRSPRWTATSRIRRRGLLPLHGQAPGHRARDRPGKRRHPARHDRGLRRQHTSTHGAFGALAHGIGTSEVEHVMATQTLLAKKAKNMLVRSKARSPGVTAKDIVLAIIGKIGTAGGTGYTIEFAGSAIRDLSMEGRMTVCNMAIEGGARAGLVAVDDKTIDYVKGRPWPHRRRMGWPSPTGRRCTPTPMRSSTPWSSSTPPRSCRRSPGAPRPRWCWASTPACPIPTRKRTPTSAAPSNAR